MIAYLNYSNIKQSTKLVLKSEFVKNPNKQTNNKINNGWFWCIAFC